MKKLLSTCVLSAAIGLTVSQGVSAKETIVLGELNWDGAVAIEHVLKVVMEENFDVNVEIIAADQAAIWSAMDSGKGSIDVFPDIWTTLQDHAWAKFVAEGGTGSVKANKVPYLGENGFFIPGYIQDEYGVKSVSDLAKPEIAKLFDKDGDGVGEYWAGASGWELVKTNQIKAKSYGFDKYFTPEIFSSSIMQAQLKKAYRKKEGILFYYWTPAWIHYAYDLRKLEEPAFTGYSNESKKDSKDYNPDGCYNYANTDNWLADSEITCDYPIVPVHIGYTASLEGRAPEVAKFLSNVSLDADVVSQWIFALSTGEDEASVVAKKWVDSNSDIIKSWLK
ncbi:glycine betaine ABC transporter substrate-binding protein [Marinomonas ushuaiensis]|nr:glycine betaine ABC transporter substrate-binding protein [Marinomonas ushuaiensis]